MELKTLKNMGINHLEFCDIEGRKIYLTDVIKIPELRAEAVKWVKEFRKLNGRTSLGRFGKNTSAGVCYGLIHFFNITEEELK